MEVTASEFRKYAREALKGRWMKAGGVAIVASFLGASISGGGFVNSFSNSINSTNNVLQNGGGGIGTVSSIPASVMAGILGLGLIILIYAFAAFIISGATTLGYARYNLNLVDDRNPQLSDVFSQFHRLGSGLLMVFLRELYVYLWTLLFIIPGIIARYRYAMAAYILSENPEMTANEAITESKMLMKGNKMRLFGLELSFLGWIILSALALFPIIMLVAPLAMGVPGTISGAMVVLIVVVIIAYAVAVNLFLNPYIEAANAAFYREIKDGKYSSPEVEVEIEAEKESGIDF